MEALTGISGLADMAVNADEPAIDAIKKFLSYLPSYNAEPPPVASVPPGSDAACQKVLEIMVTVPEITVMMRKNATPRHGGRPSYSKRRM